MNEKIISRINEIDFKILQELQKIIKTINLELNQVRGENYYFSIEQILIHKTKEELNEILLKYSNTYYELCTNSNYKQILFLLEDYIERVYKHYDRIMFSEQSKFDQYVSYSKSDSPGKTYNIEDLEMDLHNISNSISLMNEAIRLWYEVYSNKLIIAEFSDGEILEFKIKESELAHLFGVIWQSLKNNEGLKKMGIIIPDTELTDEEKYDILLKITEMYNNGNILQYEEDRLRKMLYTDRYYKVAKLDNYFDFFKKDKALLPYPKINVRSKAFIDYKPLDKLSLLLDFKQGVKVIKSDKPETKNTLLLSKNSYSDKFNWTGILSTKDFEKDKNFMRSLLINSPDEYRKYMELLNIQDDNGDFLAKESISTKIILQPESGSGGYSKEKIFTEEEQVSFLQEVLEDYNQVSFNHIIDYYNQLLNKYQKGHTR